MMSEKRKEEQSVQEFIFPIVIDYAIEATIKSFPCALGN